MACNGDQRKETRIATHRKRAVKALTLDTGSLGNVGDTLRLGKVAQSNEKNTGLVRIFQRSFQILVSKFGVLAEASERWRRHAKC